MARKSVVKLQHIFKFFTDERSLVGKGENAYESRHVDQVLFDGDVRIIRGKVHASMKDKLYEVQIGMDDDGTVKDGECNCPRGQVRCHHMAALLIYAHHNISVTDKHCSWKRKSDCADDSHVPVEELFTNPNTERYEAMKGTLSLATKDKFLKSMHNKFGLHVGFSWLLSPEVDSSGFSIHSIESILMSDEFRNSSEKAQMLIHLAKLNLEEIGSIERRTVGQSSNPLWLIARRFMLTASNFGIVLKACNLGRYPDSLFKRLLGTYNLQGVKAVQWGVDHEGEARKLFEDAFGFKVEPCGLFIHGSGLLGASPDGVIDEDNLLEIKCPYKMRNEHIEEAIKTEKNYILKFNDTLKTIEVNKEHEYYHQIQGQLFLANRKCCNLVVWSTKGFVNVPVPKDEAWSPNIEKLLMFYCQELLPRILKGSSDEE